MKQTYIGFPSGSLKMPTLELVANAGVIDLKSVGRANEFATKIPWLTARILDRKDMPVMIQKGFADFGITGWDYLEESWLREKMEAIDYLPYSRASQEPTRLVLAAKTGQFESVEQIQWEVIVTELPRLTQKRIQELFGFSPVMEVSQWATEAWTLQWRVIAEITESGTSLNANKLTELATLFESKPTVFAPNGKVTSLMRDITYLLTQTLEQIRYPKFLYRMNVPTAQRDQVLQILVWAKSPTLLPTWDAGWTSIEVLMKQDVMLPMIWPLNRLGVTDIVPLSPIAVY